MDKREAEVRLAQIRADRAAAELKEAKEPAPGDRRKLEAQQAEAEAALKAAQEGLKVARLNLASTRLTAPISGKIGRPLIAVGSLATDGMSLAAIDSVDPMCVAFDVDERTVLELRRNPPHLQGGPALPVLVALQDEQGYPRRTTVDSADTRLSSGGNALWRAMLPNPDGLLMPGMLVRVRLVTSDPFTALLVPQRATYTENTGRSESVFIVTDQNVVQLRKVVFGREDNTRDDIRVVEQGLTADDWVIEDGRFGEAPCQEGTKVTPKRLPAAVPPAGATKAKGSGAAP